jgi:uncharacterized membrane protein
VSRRLGVAVTLAACGWVGLLLFAPRLPPAVAAVIYAVGSLICHQRPERSFHLDHAQLPVCARCAGIYAGAAIGAIAATGWWRPGARSVVPAPRLPLIAAAIPTAITLIVEWGGLADPGNSWRAVSGVVLGAGVAAVVLTLNYDECASRRPITSSLPPPRI